MWSFSFTLNLFILLVIEDSGLLLRYLVTFNVFFVVHLIGLFFHFFPVMPRGSFFTSLFNYFLLFFCVCDLLRTYVLVLLIFLLFACRVLVPASHLMLFSLVSFQFVLHMIFFHGSIVFLFRFSLLGFCAFALTALLVYLAFSSFLLVSLFSLLTIFLGSLGSVDFHRCFSFCRHSVLSCMG